MKAIAVFLVWCLLSVSMVTSAHAQFLQQFPQQLPQQQQPIIVYPQQMQNAQQGNNGDHTILQILAMQNMFSQQTAVQQGWAAAHDRSLAQILSNQEAWRAQANAQMGFDQVYRGQSREREALAQGQLLDAIRAGQMQQPRRRGLFGR